MNVDEVRVNYFIAPDNTETDEIRISCSDPAKPGLSFPFTFVISDRYTVDSEIAEATAYLLTQPGFTDE